MTIKTSSAKAKGRNLQKWVAEKISNLLNIDYGYEDEKLIQPRIMGQSGTDIVLRGEAFDKFKYDVECKAQENWGVHAAIKQAKNNQREDRQWLLIMKRNREHPVVILDADHFFNILEKGMKNDK